MHEPGVELQGRIAGNVTVLAARMLQHGLDRVEGRERRVRVLGLFGGRKRPAAEKKGSAEQYGQQPEYPDCFNAWRSHIIKTAPAPHHAASSKSRRLRRVPPHVRL